MEEIFNNQKKEKIIERLNDLQIHEQYINDIIKRMTEKAYEVKGNVTGDLTKVKYKLTLIYENNKLVSNDIEILK